MRSRARLAGDTGVVASKQVMVGGQYVPVLVRSKGKGRGIDSPIHLARQRLDVASSVEKERSSLMYVSASEM